MPVLCPHHPVHGQKHLGGGGVMSFPASVLAGLPALSFLSVSYILLSLVRKFVFEYRPGDCRVISTSST